MGSRNGGIGIAMGWGARCSAVLATAAVVAVMLLTGAPQSSAAAPYTNGKCPNLMVGTTTPVEGGSLRVSGTDFGANTNVRLTLHTTTYFLADVTTTKAGSFATTVHLPSNVTGPHHIVGTDATKCPSAAVIINISGKRTSPPGPPLAFTGVEVTTLSLLGALLLLTGGLLVLLGRREADN
jgi:hypothetical protein